MRGFQGRASEELYNEALTTLYNSLKTLYEKKEPELAEDNALWIDNNVLKIKRNGKFETLFNQTFQSMEKTIDLAQPINPKPGQFWINEGVLLFYNGIKWEAVKATTIEDFSMDGFDPFLIIDTLQAGENEIIKKQYNVIEEEFIASEGAKDFILQKAQYEPMKNKITVYINGRILSKSSYIEASQDTVRLITPLKKDERVMFQYMPKHLSKNSNYIPLKFHPALTEESFIIKTPSHIIKLSSDCLLGKENTMIYVNGRLVGNRYYSVEDSRTIRLIAELEENEEVLVQYIDRLVQESLPDAEVVIVEETAYSQYLWPSSQYDRLFMNGKLHLDYEVINKTSIQYPTNAVQGKLLSAVHVHPRNICNIEKRVYSIDKKSGYVQVDELNTEFYAITRNKDITDADMSQSHLYPNVSSKSMLSSDTCRSFIMHVQPETSYTIKRSILSNTFKITEHTERPTIGSGYLTFVEVANAATTNTPYTLTTRSETQFILICIDSTNGEWHAPVITSDYISTRTKLLVKTQATDTDYISSVGGIVVSNYIKQDYEYILAITYEFGETNGRGVLTRAGFDITDSSQIIIGNIRDPILVFAQGHYLIEQDNYTYNKDIGLLTLLFPEQLDIGVLTFPRYEGGYILEKDNRGYGLITLQKNMTKPLVFVYGETLQQLADYCQDGNMIYVSDAEIDMSYAVVDCVDVYGDSMFLSEGILQYDEKVDLYYAPIVTNFDNSSPVLFVNGLLISSSDIYFENNRLYVYNKAGTNMSYTLLKDTKQRLLHSDMKEANTFATQIGADQSLLYVDGNIVGDIEAFGVKHLPSSGYQREIKGLLTYDTKLGYVVNSWHIYQGDSWQHIDNPIVTEELEMLLCDYILENKTVHFTKISGIRNKRCEAWLYKYDEYIENPLLYYSILMQGNTRFEVLPAHGYKLNQNVLSVYIDGYRQYPQKINFESGVKEIDEHTFEILSPSPGSTLDYIIELPEAGETKSCTSEILTSNDIYNQTLKTNVALLPGFIDLFIDGIRQPSTSFEVVDNHSIVLEGFVKDPRYQNIILIEVRKDFYLKEVSRVIERNGQTTFACVDEMKSLLSTKDFVKIYVNGVYVSDEYVIVREQGFINIPRLAELGFNKKGHVVTFVWR